MSDILHQITINAPKDKVYAALSTVDDLAGWWTSTTKGESAPGKTLEFRFGEHVTKMRVEELDEGKHVAWQCTHSLPAWLGTRFTFDLTEDGDGPGKAVPERRADLDKPDELVGW